MNHDCLYISGRCDHAECAAWPMPVQRQPEPTVEDYCAAEGHSYYGDEFDPADVPEEYRDEVGRCYCGTKRYPPGGPTDNQSSPSGSGVSS